MSELTREPFRRKVSAARDVLMEFGLDAVAVKPDPIRSRLDLVERFASR